MLNEPLTNAAAKKLLVAIIESGKVEFSSHAITEMTADNISQDEATSVLRGGVVEPAEFVRGSWRYRVRAGKTYVVVAFRSETWTVVVTAWRRK